MAKKFRWWMTGAVLMTIGAVAMSGPSSAQGCWRRPFARGGLFVIPQPCLPIVVEPTVLDRPKEVAKEPPLPALDKDLRVNVMNLAQLLKEGNTAGATKFARMVAPSINEIGDLMQLYRPRDKGGLGWGRVRRSNPGLDGIDVQLRNIARNVPVGLAVQTKNNEEAAYWIAAIAEVSIAKPWGKDSPKGKTRKLWLDTAKQLRDVSLEFAHASELGDASGMKDTAFRIHATCNACHAKFKE